MYGAYPYTNNPADGSAHRFYDESRTLIGDWPAGTVLKLQKDAGVEVSCRESGRSRSERGVTRLRRNIVKAQRQRKDIIS